MNDELKGQIAETLLNPPTGVVIGGGVGIFQSLVTQLPVIINIATVIYLVILIVHKLWTFYKEWKKASKREQHK